MRQDRDRGVPTFRVRKYVPVTPRPRDTPPGCGDLPGGSHPGRRAKGARGGANGVSGGGSSPLRHVYGPVPPSPCIRSRPPFAMFGTR